MHGIGGGMASGLLYFLFTSRLLSCIALKNFVVTGVFHLARLDLCRCVIRKAVLRTDKKSAFGDLRK